MAPDPEVYNPYAAGGSTKREQAARGTHQRFEHWDPPCTTAEGLHCFVFDSRVCVNCHLVKGDSLWRSRTKKPHGEIWRPRKLYLAQGGKCYYCDQQMTLGEVQTRLGATVEHVIPLSRGGGNGANLVAACRYCNNCKGDWLPVEWITEIAAGRSLQKYSDETRQRVLNKLALLVGESP